MSRCRRQGSNTTDCPCSRILVRGSGAETGGRLSITKTTVTEFATELNLSPAALLKQPALPPVLPQAECRCTPLSRATKAKLLDYLRKQHGAADESAGKRITLTRKSTTELRTADASGKSRTVQAEVRKKRVLVTRAAEAPAPAAAQTGGRGASAEEVAAREAGRRDAALREAQNAASSGKAGARRPRVRQQRSGRLDAAEPQKLRPQRPLSTNRRSRTLPVVLRQPGHRQKLSRESSPANRINRKRLADSAPVRGAYCRPPNRVAGAGACRLHRRTSAVSERRVRASASA